KENNTRIHFDDTSASASFPKNDWRLTANDTTNGGGEYFAIQDATANTTVFRVDAGAGNNAMRISSDGNVGIGTASPGGIELNVTDGDSPTIRLAQDGSAGFQTRSWDIAGNETNFFVRDVNDGSALPFRIFPGTGDDTAVLRNGRLGVNKDNPQETLDVNGNAAVAGELAVSTDGSTVTATITEATNNTILDLANTAAGAGWQFQSRTNGTFVLLNSAQASNAAIKIDPAITNNSLVIRDQGIGIGDGTPTVATVNGEVSLDVNGPIYQRGTSLHADYVFEDDYQLLTLEEQAAFIAENKHLPAVPGRTINENGKEVIELGAHRQGMLEELEKAHLYIQQLHGNISELTEEKDAKIAQLEERLAALEAAIQN
ncbi:MAG: hypothetical protein AAGD38_24545, partial [Acidobacteriota bacterium]